MYNALWNILNSSKSSLLGGLIVVRLFSIDMFHFIVPWLPGMLLLSVVLHILGFNFYARVSSKKNAEELNRILK